MNALYTFSLQNLPQIKEKLAKNFSKITIFEINFNEKAFLASPKSKILSLIGQFENLKSKFDFIIVLGVLNTEILGKNELNLKLAKHLNCPIFAKNFSELCAISINSKLLITDDLDKILSFNQNIITQEKFEFNLAKQARALNSHIVLPESEDERVLKAASEISAKNLAQITLLGDENLVKENAKRLNINISSINILNPQTSELLPKFTEQIYEARKTKGISHQMAQSLAKERNYFAVMLVKNAMAHGVVSGAVGTTADTIRPALQLIKTKSGISSVSGLFFMALEEEILIFADCAVTPSPDASTLAQIAISSDDSAKSFGIEPHVALLSYSTLESGSGESVEMIKDAVKILQNTELNVDGPLQFDAAINSVIAAKKAPGSSVAGRANVFVFPDLNSANICYKAVQQSAHALAVGPVLQGLNAPVNDLSRGATTQDIVNTILITAIQAGENK